MPFLVDMFVKILMLMVLSTVITCNGQDNLYCTESNIKRAQTACNKAYGGLSGSDLSPICRSLDCVLQCLKDAVLDCWKTDQFFNYDLNTTVVRYRAMCQDIETRKRAQSACNPTSCEKQYLKPNYTERMRKLYNSGDFAGYKQLECGRARDTLNCIPTAPVGPDCSTELKDLSKGLETVRYSMSQCGIAQNHQFFETYADKGTPCPNPGINNNCLLTPLTERASKCLKIPDLSSGSSGLIANVCSDIECNLKCYLNAISDCYKEDRLFNMDPKVIKVVGRAICDNRQGTASPFNLCPVNNQTCVDEFNSAWTKASAHLMSGDYTEFKRSLCQASKDFRACVDVTVTNTCTSSIAEQARSMYQAGYSYAACGPQDHAYFTKYGGDVNCITSANTRLMTSFIDVMLFTVIFMLWL